MDELKFKVGDKAIVKSLEWYNANKNMHENICVIGEPYDIDLCEILKDAPTGMKLYSTVYGDVHLQTIRPDDQYPVRVRTKSYGNQAYSNNGRYYKDIGDVTLFPSYDNRDWESFKLPSK